jgi:hypothetical protein
MDVYDVLMDAQHPAYPDVGRLLWNLVMTQWHWVDRRVETVTLVGERRFRRHMSVDCRVPPEVTEAVEELGLDRFLVPLRLVAERPLLSFDLHLGDHPVPFLTRAQGRQAERAVLRAAVEQLDRPLSPEEMAAVDAVAIEGRPAAEPALRLLGLSEPAHLLGSATGTADATPEQLAHWAITTFAGSFLLLADVALADVRQRALFKISEEIGPEVSKSLPLVSEVGWRSTEFVFDAQDVVAAGSYHFQFIAPDGLMVDGGQLFAAAADEKAERVAFGAGSSQGQVLGVNAHVEDVPEADTYSVAVRLRPSPEGLLRASAISATFSTALLILAALLQPRIAGSRLESSATLLLVLPGVVSTMFLRPGEHSLVSQMLRGTRIMLLVSAVLLYLAAAAVLVVDDPTTTSKMLRVWWGTLALVSCVPTVTLGKAVWRSMAHPHT